VIGGRRSTVRPLLFAARRVRHRPTQLLLLVVPLVIAGGLIGASSLIGELALEDSVRTKLASEPAAGRSFAVEYRVESGRGQEVGSAIRRALSSFRAVTGPSVQVQIWDPIAPADQRGVRLVTTGDPTAVELDSGRRPQTCRKRACEGLAIAGHLPVGRVLTIGTVNGRPVRLSIVGAGSLRERALPDRDLLAGNAVFVPRVGGALASVEAESSSTVSQSALLRPNAVHAADLDALAERMRIASVRLERLDESVAVSSPADLLRRFSRVGTVAKNRLLIVASEGAALMLAFAAFVASLRRPEVDRLRLQLDTLGASRRQVRLARMAEVAVPALLALALVLGGLRIALVPIMATRGLPASFAGQALPLSTLLAIVGLELIGILILFASAVPVVRARFGVGPLEVAALTALGVIVWQAAATGGLDPDQIAAGKGGLPVLLLTPALAALVAAIALLRLLPPLFRVAERLARGAPAVVRLALLAAARNPGLAAATTTFLAVALGSALFSLNYRATLQHQATAAAAFEVGAPARATVAGAAGTADASPLLRRYPGATPALRLSASVEEGGGRQRPVTIFALPARRMTKIAGWEQRFSSLSRTNIAARLRPRPKVASTGIPGLPAVTHAAKPATLTGPALPPRTTALRLWARSNSSAVRSVLLHLLLPGDGFTTLALGNLPHSWRLLQAKVPPSLEGARLVGIEFPVGASVATSVIIAPGAVSGNVTASKEAVDFGGLAARTPSRWRPLPSLAGWTGARAPDFEGILLSREFAGAPIAHGSHFLLNGTSVPLVRQPVDLATAGAGSSTYLLPALAGPSPFGLAVDRQLTVDVLGQELRLRPIGRASLFPTVTSDPGAFLVVDYATLFAALNADQPGLAPPTEALFFGRPPTSPAAGQFLRFDQERTRLLEDPLAAGTRQLLSWSGYAAAALALLGLVLSIRLALESERGVLAEYEALGVAPRTLGLAMQLRLVFLSLLGLAAALVGASLAVRLVTALVAVTGTATRPLPPITTAIAWQTGGVLLGVVAVAVILAAPMLVGRSLREAAGRRLRV
jgi:hypothetical protein